MKAIDYKINQQRYIGPILFFKVKQSMNNLSIDGVIMKTNNQIELIVFRREPGLGFKCLMLKRNQKKGGFWQPITGNVEIGENFEQAAVRELKEETKITEFLRIFDTGHSFDFFDDERLQHEKVFAVEVSVETKISLSDEHVDFVWATKDDCLNKFLKYPGNIAGLKALYQKLENTNE